VTAREPGLRILEDGELAADLVGEFFGARLAAITDLPDGAIGQQPFALTIPPAGRAVAHDHGQRETLVHVLSGSGNILWGQQLEHAARIGPGASVLVPAGAFHQEINESTDDELELLVFGDDAPSWAGAHQLAP
jgi:uncharacterized RmlC-like cupin family protein